MHSEPSTVNPASCYLALGSNIGNKEENIKRAYGMIEERAGSIVRESALFYSKPWGFVSDNDFINSVVCIKTMMTPRQLLKVTQEIERDMGRERKSQNGEYHDRIIDIDIILYELNGESVTVNEPDLIIPHPLMTKREFVMVPLNEISNYLTKTNP